MSVRLNPPDTLHNVFKGFFGILCQLCQCVTPIYILIYPFYLFLIIAPRGELISHPEERDQEDSNYLARLIVQKKLSQPPPAQGKQAGNIETLRRYKRDGETIPWEIPWRTTSGPLSGAVQQGEGV